MILKAYAKVNLILKVNNKLDSGYHNLQMINAFIDLYDEIEIVESDIDLVEYINSDINKDEDIVLKGLKLFKNIYNIEKFLAIWPETILGGFLTCGGYSRLPCSLPQFGLRKLTIFM